MEYCRKKRQQCYLVHRLDQDTSGVLMFVKNKKLYQELTHNWNKYVKTRGYVAILEGQCRKSGTIKNHLVEVQKEDSSSYQLLLHLLDVIQRHDKSVLHHSPVPIYISINSYNHFSSYEYALQENLIVIHLLSHFVESVKIKRHYLKPDLRMYAVLIIQMNLFLYYWKKVHSI